MANPKLEGIIEVTTQWSVYATDTATTTVIVLPAGSYYWNSVGASVSSACEIIATALTANTQLSRTWTCTIDDDADTSTGKMTLGVTAGTCAFSWAGGSPDPATVTGLASDASAAASHTGASAAQYLWLPDSGRQPGLLAPDGDEGANEEDVSQVVAPSGRINTIRIGSGRYVDNLGFRCAGHKMWKTYETTTNESMQRFWEQVIREGYQFRYHKDRSTDGTYVTWVAEAAAKYDAPPLAPDWIGATARYNWASRVRKYIA